MSDLPPLPPGATLNPLPADLTPLPPGATLNPVSADAALPPLPPGAKLNPVAPPPGATEKPQEPTSTYRAPLAQGTPPSDPLAPPVTPPAKPGYVAPTSQKAALTQYADAGDEMNTPRAFKGASSTQEDIGAKGAEAVEQSPWAGRPYNESAGRTLERSDAKKAVAMAGPNTSEEQIATAGSDVGGIKDFLSGAGKMAAETVGGVPQLSRTMAKVFSLPADTQQWGLDLAGKLTGTKPIKDSPFNPIMTPLVAQGMNALINDVEPAYHKIAKSGGDIAESYMTPEYKDSIAKQWQQGIKDPLWWENQAAVGLGFMATDGMLVGGVARSAYASTFARTAAELATQKMPQSMAAALARQAAEKQAVKSGMVASVIFNGGAMGGQTGQQVRETITGLDDPTKMKFQSYRDDRDAGMSEAVATENLANDKSAMATVIAFTAAGVSGGVLGHAISSTAIGMRASRSVAGSIAKSTAEATVGGAVQGAGLGLASRAGTAPSWSDLAHEERESSLNDAIGSAITFAPLGLMGGFGVKRTELNKITDNAMSGHPRVGVSQARDNLLAADYALKRVQDALDDPRVQVGYNDLQRAQKTRTQAFKDYIAAGENAGLIGDEANERPQQAAGDQGVVGRVQRPASEPGPAGRVPQREAGSGQQPEGKLAAEVQAQAGDDAGRSGQQSLTPLSVEEGALPGEPATQSAGKPKIRAKSSPDQTRELAPLPGPLGAEGPFKDTPGEDVTSVYAGKPKITLKPAKEGGFEPPKIITPEASKNIAAIPPPNYPLSGAETAVSNRMKRVVSNVDAAEVAYAKLSDTDGGSVINTDSIREMSPDYASSLKAKSRFSNAVQEASSWLADQLYTRRLAKPVRAGKEAKVFFTAGGPDSGKSVSLGSDEAQSADMIYDGNMNNLAKARRRIKAALDSGRSVDIQFHDRDPIESFKSMLMRAMKMGRAVPVEAHAAANNDSFKTVSALSRQYKGDKRVRFHVIDVDKFKSSDMDAIADKHYDVTSSHLHKIAAEEYQSGRITEAVFRGVSGKRAERLVGRGADHGQLPGKQVEVRGSELNPAEQAGAVAEGHVRGEEGDRVGAQEKDQLGKDVPGKVQIAFRTDERHPLVNIGLKVGETGSISREEAEAALKAKGVDIVSSSVHESGTESTLVAKLSRKLTPEEAHSLSVDLKQEAIPQYADGKGEMHGPEKEKWGDFNPDYFLTENGTPLSDEPRSRTGIQGEIGFRRDQTGSVAGDKPARERTEEQDDLADFIKAHKEDWLRNQRHDIIDEAARSTERDRGFRVDKDADTISFRHFSRTDSNGFTVDPSRMGTGLKGAEAGRNGPKVISAYAEDHPNSGIEAGLRGLPEYRITVPRSKMYDLSADPMNFVRKATGKNGYDHTKAENAIKRAGYLGYHLPNGEGNFKGQARIFGKVEAKRTFNPSAADKKADSARRAKGWQASPDELGRTNAERAVIRMGGMGHTELKEVTEHVTKRFGVKVNIVEHPRDMPDRISEWEAENLPISGVFIDDPDGGTVHLFRANLGSADHAAITAYHEIVGHYGLRGILKQHGVDHYAGVMDGIATSFPQLIPKMAKRNRIDLAAGGVVARRSAAEEIVAYASEQRVLSTEHKGLFDKVIDYVHDALQRIGVIRDADGARLNSLFQQGRNGIWTEADITSLIDRSAQALRRGAGKRLLARDLLSQRITGKPRQYNMGESEAPRWHSALVDAVEGSKQAKASADQWKGTLKGLSGVKKEEMDWLGVHEWLDKQTGSVPKADLLNYLREHQVQLGETNLSERSRTLNKESPYYTTEVARVIRENGGINGRDALGLSIALANDREAADEIHDKFPKIFNQRSDIPWYTHVLRDIGASDNPTPTSYNRESLNIPGGENYAEKLLTVPKGEGDGFKVTDSNGHVLPKMYDNQYEAMNDAKTLGGTVARAPKAAETYRSTHWSGHDNVLAHVRYDERTDAQGKRNLFLQEIQSDWHQAGRKHGYNTEPQGEWTPDDGTNTPGDPLHMGVPDAPFKTSWHELALKRMLQHAAENGFDRVSWTTGDQQNARYNLAKHVNSLKLFSNEGGEHILKAYHGSAGSNTSKVWKTEAEMHAGLPDMIGKAVADKLLAQETRRLTLAGRTLEEHAQDIGMKSESVFYKEPRLFTTRELSGQNLEVGGSGMKGFYDKMLPAAAEKLTKKFGGKVGTTSFKTDNAPDDVVARYADQPDHPFTKLQQTVVHSIDITPEMRKAATAGGPLTAMFRTNAEKSKDMSEFLDKVAEKESPTRRAVRDTIAKIAKYLTPDEKGKLNRATAQRVVDQFNQLPSAKEMAHVAYAGRAKRGWYKQSAEAISNVFGHDAPRFSALLASMSPQTSVETNLMNAVSTWKNWDAAGRPQTRGAIFKIMGDSVEGNKLTDSVLPSWINNTVSSLTHPNPETLTISGPKVNSFMRNLHGHVADVTLDSWMAHYANVDAKIFGGQLNATKTEPGKSTAYMAYSARVRQAAEHLSKLTGETWTPAEVQETIWSWSKAASEHSDSFKGMASIADLVKDKDISDALIKGTPDFSTLFLGGEQETVLRQAGYGEQLDGLRRQSQAAQPTDAGQAPKIAVETLEPSLLKAAARLTESRSKKTTEPSLQQGEAHFAVGGAHDPDMESFLSKINPDKRSFTEKIGGFLKNIRSESELFRDKVVQGIFDKTWGIQRAWRISGNEGPNLGRMSARLAANHASLMDALIRYGTPTWNGDAPAISGHTGFQDILAPLGKKVDDFFRALVARRADRLMGEGRENLFTQPEIDAGNRLWTQNPEFEHAYTELAKFKKGVLDFAEQAGVISKSSRALWEHDDYVPFFRVMNEDGEIGGHGSGNEIGRVRQQINRLTGGTSALGDPMENMLRNWDSLMKSSLRTKALQLTVDSIAHTGMVERFTPPHGTTLSRDAFRQQLSDQGIDADRVTGETFDRMYEHAAYIPESKNHVWLWRNGVKEHYLVHDPVLFRALTNMNDNGRSGFQALAMKVLSAPKRFLTAAIVKSPIFIGKVLMRHSFLQFLSGHQSETVLGDKHIMPDFIPVWDTAKGIYKIMKGTQESRDLAAAGGTFVGAHASGNTSGIAKGIKGRGIIIDSALKFSAFYSHLLSATEGTHRLAVAQAVEKEGGSRLQQAFAARNVLDYSKGGDYEVMRFFCDTVPFLKAGISGASSAYELAVRNPLGVGTRAGLMAMSAVAYAYMHKDNEEYKALTNDQKINYYHFWPGGVHIQIPKGFDSADIVTTIPEALTDLALSSENDRVKNAVSMVGDVVWHQIAMGGLPTLISPMVGELRNKQAYSGSPILNQQDLSVAPQAQDAPYVSPTYRGIAQNMPEFMPDFAKSPKQLQYLGASYLGTLGQFATAASDWAINKSKGIEAPTRGFPQDVPAMSQVYSTGPSRRTKYSDQMYAYAKQVDEAADTFKKYMKGGEVERGLEFHNEHLADIVMQPAIDEQVKAVNSLYKQQRVIQQMPGMSGKDKQERMDQIQEVINTIAKRAFDLRPGGKLSPFQASKLIGATRSRQVNLLQSYGLPATASLLKFMA